MSEGAAEILLEHRFAARPDRLAEARDRVARACREAGCSEPCARDVVLAVDEACQNVIRHAYHGDPDGEIVLEIRRDGARLVVYLEDFAPRVDPERIRPRDLDDLRPGGLGTHFIREVMDEREFLPPGTGRPGSRSPTKGNLMRMAKRIA
jgi:sigma-B regulation protein RsbU (phosphoserine phosphatase)